MKFAVDICNYGAYADPLLLVNLACEAEAAGWDGFFIWDHIVSGGQSPVTDPWVALSAIATKTDRIRLGTMVTPLVRRRPWKIARETVALDHLSGGRVTLGVGLGYNMKKEFEPFGEETDPVARGQILDEALDVLTGLWSGEPFSYKGSHYQVKKSIFKPAPVQSPRIPIWTAGMWPNKRPFQRGSRWDGIFPLGKGANLKTMLPPEVMTEIITYVRGLRSAEDGPFDVVHAGISEGKSLSIDAQLSQSYADVGVTWWLENVFPGRGSVSKMRSRIKQGPPCE